MEGGQRGGRPGLRVDRCDGAGISRIAEALRLAVLRSADSEARLPTEAELADQHGVSRQTVRRAYQELVADGLVRRIPGRGTFAARGGSQYLRRFGTVEDLMSLSVDTEMEVLVPLTRRVEIEAAGRLGLSNDVTATISFRRLHLGVPFCVTDVYLPPSVGAAHRRRLRGAARCPQLADDHRTARPGAARADQRRGPDDHRCGRGRPCGLGNRMRGRRPDAADRPDLPDCQRGSVELAITRFVPPATATAQVCAADEADNPTTLWSTMAATIDPTMWTDRSHSFVLVSDFMGYLRKCEHSAP